MADLKPESSWTLVDRLEDLAASHGFRVMLAGSENPSDDQSIIFVDAAGYISTISIDIPRYESGRLEAVVKLIETEETALPNEWRHLSKTGLKRLNEAPVKTVSEVLALIGPIVADQGFGVDPDNLPSMSQTLNQPATLEIYNAVADLDYRLIRFHHTDGVGERIDLDLGKSMVLVEIRDDGIKVRCGTRSTDIRPEDHSDGMLGSVVRDLVVLMNSRTRGQRMEP